MKIKTGLVVGGMVLGLAGLTVPGWPDAVAAPIAAPVSSDVARAQGICEGVRIAVDASQKGRDAFRSSVGLPLDNPVPQVWEHLSATNLVAARPVVLTPPPTGELQQPPPPGSTYRWVVAAVGKEVDRYLVLQDPGVVHDVERHQYIICGGDLPTMYPEESPIQ